MAQEMNLSGDLRTFKDLKGTMIEEGVIGHTFLSLERMQDKKEPRFVFDLITLFFDDAEQVLLDINQAMDKHQINLVLADSFVHKLKGLTRSLGVPRISHLADVFRTCFLARNVDGCMRAVEQINQDYLYCKARLQSLKNIAEKIWAAGGFLPGSGASL